MVGLSPSRTTPSCLIVLTCVSEAIPENLNKVLALTPDLIVQVVARFLDELFDCRLLSIHLMLVDNGAVAVVTVLCDRLKLALLSLVKAVAHVLLSQSVVTLQLIHLDRLV